jgi:hypothetical protein
MKRHMNDDDGIASFEELVSYAQSRYAFLIEQFGLTGPHLLAGANWLVLAYHSERYSVEVELDSRDCVAGARMIRREALTDAHIENQPSANDAGVYLPEAMRRMRLANSTRLIELRKSIHAKDGSSLKSMIKTLDADASVLVEILAALRARPELIDSL